MFYCKAAGLKQVRQSGAITITLDAAQLLHRPVKLRR